jgi:hypothetical protein
VRSLHRPRGVGHCGAQAAGEPDAGDGEVSQRPEGHCSGGEPTGVPAHASVPAPWRGVAWRLPACLHCAWRGGAGAASPGAPRAPAVHHARLESVDFTVRSSAAGPPCTHPVHMHLSCAHPVHMHAPQVIKKNCAFDSNRRGSMVIDVAPSWAAPSSPLRLPSPAWRLWAARHFQAEAPRPLGAPPLPGCSSEPPPRSPIPPPLARLRRQARQDPEVDRHYTP